MTVEADIFNTLKSLVGNRCFPDFAPIDTIKPYITYVQIGGEALSYTENALPDAKNGRFQVNVWASTRSIASSVMLQVEAALMQATAFQARPIGAAAASYDFDMQTYGSMQDFSIWSTR